MDPRTAAGWSRPSPRWWTGRRLLLAAGVVVLGGPAVVGSALASTAAGASVGAGVVVLAVVGYAVLRGRYRSWAWTEREDDLLVRRGLLVRRLSVVPYGRMQFVDVSAGPLDRLLGLATVQLHTAAAATDARVPGLPAAEAERLRDRLAALGEARAAGL